MTKKQLIETIRRVIKETLNEAVAPAPSKPKPSAPAEIDPGTPEEEPDKYTLNPEKGTENIPDIDPKAKVKKVTMTEAEMLAKIIKKYRAIKKNG